jgi:hypothetical protein
MTGPTSRSTPRNRRPNLRAPRLTIPAMALFGLATVLVFVAPFAESAGVVQVSAPFSGTAFQTISHYHQGCGSNRVAHDFLFSLSTGKAYLNQESKAVVCKGTSNVLTLLQEVTNTGMNSSKFTPISGVQLSHEKIRWGLSYNWHMVTILGNSSQTTYASFTVEVLGSIYDATTGTTYLPNNSYSNSVSMADTNGSSSNHVSSAPAFLYFNVSLLTTHSYQFNTSLRLTTTVDTDGPGSSAFSDLLFYGPTLGDRATLNWFSY